MSKYALFLLVGMLIIINCGKCENEPPGVTLINNGAGKADIQIKTSGGNTENINNIYPGTSSGQRTFAAGSIEFTIAIQGVDQSIVYELDANSCIDYDVIVNSDNTVTSTGREREK